MARIEISLPNEYAFSTNIPIRISDINRGGHMGWDAMFTILDEARFQFLINLDYPEGEGKEIPHIMVDAGIIYKRQAYHGQTLSVEIAITELNDKGFDLVYKVSEANSGTEIARAKTGILYFDYRKQKVASIPDELRNKLSR